MLASKVEKVACVDILYTKGYDHGREGGGLWRQRRVSQINRKFCLWEKPIVNELMDIWWKTRRRERPCFIVWKMWSENVTMSSWHDGQMCECLAKTTRVQFPHCPAYVLWWPRAERLKNNLQIKLLTRICGLHCIKHSVLHIRDYPKHIL